MCVALAVLHFVGEARKRQRDRMRDGFFASGTVCVYTADSTWLEWLARRANSLLRYTIRLRDVDQEYWALVQPLVPDARRLIGPIASELLDAGFLNQEMLE